MGLPGPGPHQPDVAQRCPDGPPRGGVRGRDRAARSGRAMVGPRHAPWPAPRGHHFERTVRSAIPVREHGGPHDHGDHQPSRRRSRVRIHRGRRRRQGVLLPPEQSRPDARLRPPPGRREGRVRDRGEPEGSARDAGPLGLSESRPTCGRPTSAPEAGHPFGTRLTPNPREEPRHPAKRLRLHVSAAAVWGRDLHPRSRCGFRPGRDRRAPSARAPRALPARGPPPDPP